MPTPEQPLRIFSTCTPPSRARPEAALRDLAEVARWSEDAGCEGMLVYSDNAQLDPWLVSQVVIQATARLAPLVALQPAYMHPYSAAKMIASLAFLHDRRVHLNMVAGGFTNDLEALGDSTPHDERYERLAEYSTILKALVDGPEPTSLEGRYYRVKNLRMTPPLPSALKPDIFISGSSEAGQRAARRIGAVAIEYPKPAREYVNLGFRGEGARGIRIGILARADDTSAWAAAHARFPEDRKGQMTRALATKVSDSQWHKQLSERGDARSGGDADPYWLSPFHNYQAMCPYLVGSYDRVGAEIARYVEAGHTIFILDTPASAEEMRHIGFAFARAGSQRMAA